MEKSVSRNKNRRTEVEIRDRISDLPDSLLLHILSFLPTKEAVATSLLSKRWSSLWLCLPTLDFKCTEFRNLKSFLKFADQMIKLVDLKSVKKFVLDCYYKPPQKISKWINAVISSSEVERVELFICAFEVPSSVLSANNIRVLKLSMVTIGTISYINLPLLEVLHLREVKFSDFRSFERLLTSCALLKELKLKFMNLEHYGALNIAKLNHLVSADVQPCLIPLEVFANVKFLCLYQFNRQMWPFSDDMPVFDNLTELECVVDEWTKMVNCLQNFPKLQKLVIHKHGSSSPPEPILDVPLCVSLHLKEFTLLQFEGSESDCEMVKLMIENGGVLRAVYICGVVSRDDDLLSAQKLAAHLRSGSEVCSPVHRQPIVFMIS